MKRAISEREDIVRIAETEREERTGMAEIEVRKLADTGDQEARKLELDIQVASLNFSPIAR